MEQTSASNSRHTALQTIASYGRVNTGNFPDHARPILEELYEESHVIIMTDSIGERWYHLSDEGKQYLMNLNAVRPDFNSLDVT